jgi:hypothetical protein
VRRSLLRRALSRLQELWDEQDTRGIAALLVLAVLVLGGFAAALAVARASTSPTAAEPPAARIVTLHQKVRVRTDGHLVTRWRTRKVHAQPHTVLETQTIHTPTGTRLVTHPVTRYRVVYRKRVVKVHGKTRTVLQPVKNTQTLTNTKTSTKTQLVTVTHSVTHTQPTTVTQPVTETATTTVVSTETETLPITITITVTLPLP